MRRRNEWRGVLELGMNKLGMNKLRRKRRLAGALAVLLLAGLVGTAAGGCSTDGGSGTAETDENGETLGTGTDDGAQTGNQGEAGSTSEATEGLTVSFAENKAVAGEPITAVVSDAVDGTVTYAWYVGGVDTGVTEASYTPTEDDLENEITVKVTARIEQDGQTAQSTQDGQTAQSTQAEASLYFSTLPVLYLTTPNEGKVGEDYGDGTLTVQSSSSYETDEDTGYEGDIQIKLRGNSTRYRDKQPYNIKLDSKTDLLGLGKNKHWVLLAEDIDHTLLRNQLVLRFAREIGMECASNATSVVVCLNGSYRGVYTLCEQVRIGKDEINITDWSEIAEDIAAELVIAKALEDGTITERDEKLGRKKILEAAGLTEAAEKLEAALRSNYSWASEPYQYTYNGVTYTLTDYVDIPELTGGWLLEMDFYHEIHADDSVRTAYLQNFYFSEPDTLYTNEEAKAYAKTYLQTFEYALHSEDFTYHESDTHYKTTSSGPTFDWNGDGWSGTITEVEYSDPEHDGWRYDELFDMDSLINNFLVCEFSRNWDSMKNSVFLYKDVDGLAYMGPSWDYDWAFGNINMYQIDTYYPTGWQTTDYYFTNEQYYQTYNWNRYLIKDPVFVQALYDKYWEIRPTVIEELVGEGGWLDTKIAELEGPAAANDKKWSYTYYAYNSKKFGKSCTLLKDFISERIAWMDEQFADYDTLYQSLNSYEQAEAWW